MNGKPVYRTLGGLLLAVALLFGMAFSAQTALAVPPPGTDISVDAFGSGPTPDTVVVDYSIAGVDATAFDLSFYSTDFGGGTQFALVNVTDPADLTVGAHSKVFTLGVDFSLVDASNEIDSDYSLTVAADPLNAISELDETNNVQAFYGVYQYGASPAWVFAHGNEWEDEIRVTSAGQVILNGVTYNFTTPGNFRVRGHADGDLLEIFDWAGPGALFGGPGGDVMRGGPGDNLFDGGSEGDLVRFLGNVAVDANLMTGVATGHGTDTLVGIEDLEGSNAGDVLTGDDGPNSLSGGEGDDTIYGNGGDDTIYGWTGADMINAGAGSDWIDADGGNDTVYGGSGLDEIYGGQGTDYLYGDADDDLINPGTGANEYIAGGTGSDTVDFSDFEYNIGVVSTTGFIVELTTQTVTAPRPDGLGTVTKTLVGIENATGSQYDDQLVGSNGANFLKGLDGNDRLDARGGDDELDGGDGDDTLLPGTGNDTAIGSTGVDVVSYVGFTSGVTVDLMTGATAAGKTDTYPWFDIENAIGTAYADQITGNNSLNELRGEAGDDTINGNGGPDTIYGGAGNDTINGGADNDAIYGDGGNDIIDAGDGDDVVSGGVGNDTILGGTGADMLNGDGGADVLYSTGLVCGGDGAVDTLIGDGGVDIGFGSSGDPDILIVDVPILC